MTKFEIDTVCRILLKENLDYDIVKAISNNLVVKKRDFITPFKDGEDFSAYFLKFVHNN